MICEDKTVKNILMFPLACHMRKFGVSLEFPETFALP